jgi:hypothetical protein
MKIIEAQFKARVLQDEQTGRHPNSQTRNID